MEQNRNIHQMIEQERSPVEKVTIIAGALLVGMMVGACFNAIGHAKKARRKKRAERQAARAAR